MTRIVTLGDSITVGMGDPDPAKGAGWRGWAHLLAAGLPDPELHNLAVRGAQAKQVERDQLPAAPCSPCGCPTLPGCSACPTVSPGRCRGACARSTPSSTGSPRITGPCTGTRHATPRPTTSATGRSTGCTPTSADTG